MAYTDIDKPSDYFNTAPYSGDSNTTQAITGVGFQPDWVWIKSRSSAANHNLWDIIRGTSKYLKSNSTDAEITDATLFNSFNSDGFTVGNGGIVNDSGQTYVGWCWKGANGTASNTDGSITSTVSANTTSGFSIVSWTGNGSTTTVGHGLGVTPKLYITKDRTNGSTNWHYHTTQIDGGMDFAFLNQTNAFSSSSLSAPSSTLITVGGTINTSSANFISYVFAEKKGYSKFGSYTGNGSTDGTFVYTGFKPAFLLMKRTDSISQWRMWDNKRDTFNVADQVLLPNGSSATQENANQNVDLLSNGFKWRASYVDTNASGGTFIYMCFAEAPFTTSTGIPTTAR
jgi:hypothetical protein